MPAPQTGGQKPGGGREQPTWTGPPQRPNDRTQADNQARRIFTRSREGRRYDNGVRLRPGTIVQDTWHRLYFRRGRLHYPYYSPTYSPVTVVISPFAFYFGVCAPFIFRNHTYHAPPVSVFIEIPVYQGVYYRGYEPIQEQANLLDRDYLSSREPGLANALDELRETFLRKDIDALVTLVDPKVRIAVFLKGTYEYSLDPDDYLDMTRDSIRETETIGFTITRLHQRGVGVYVASGEHVYRDRDGRARRVFVSYVLENIRGIWTLTQVGTAPDRIQEW